MLLRAFTYTAWLLWLYYTSSSARATWSAFDLKLYWSSKPGEKPGERSKPEFSQPKPIAWWQYCYLRTGLLYNFALKFFCWENVKLGGEDLLFAAPGRPRRQIFNPLLTSRLLWNMAIVFPVLIFVYNSFLKDFNVSHVLNAVWWVYICCKT